MSSTARRSRTPTSDEARIRLLYELFFQRPPNVEEVRLGQQFIATFQPAAAAAGAPRGFGAGDRGQGPGRGRGPRGAAAGQGRGQPMPVRVPLTGWQEYAHALLLTNEAAFVN